MHKTKTTAILAAGLLATAVGIASSGVSTTRAAAAAPPPCTPAWQVAPTPSMGGTVGSVSVSSSSNAWFTFGDPLSAPPYWTGHWDGHSMRTAAQPVQVPGPNLQGLGSSFDSPDDGWQLVEPALALGANFGLGSFSLAEHWTGGRWKLTASAVNPDFANTKLGLFPVAVASLSPGDAWAVGGYDDQAAQGRGGHEVGALTEHWNGTQWDVVPNPVSSKDTTMLTAISADSARDAWSVGYQSTSSGQVAPLIEHWDGTRWAEVSTPALPADVTVAALTSVTSHGTEIWAGGYQRVNGVESPLIEQYSGGAWTVASAVPGLDAFRIGGIYAAAPGDVWATAAPDYIRGTPADTGLGRPGKLLHWDGQNWTEVTPPGPQEWGLTYTYTSIAGTGPDDIWIGGGTFDLAALGSGDPDPQSPLVAHLSC